MHLPRQHHPARIYILACIHGGVVRVLSCWKLNETYDYEYVRTYVRLHYYCVTHTRSNLFAGRALSPGNSDPVHAKNLIMMTVRANRWEQQLWEVALRTYVSEQAHHHVQTGDRLRFHVSVTRMYKHTCMHGHDGSERWMPLVYVTCGRSSSISKLKRERSEKIVSPASQRGRALLRLGIPFPGHVFFFGSIQWVHAATRRTISMEQVAECMQDHACIMSFTSVLYWTCSPENALFHIYVCHIFCFNNTSLCIVRHTDGVL
jgi:hypothetical protein